MLDRLNKAALMAMTELLRDSGVEDMVADEAIGRSGSTTGCVRLSRRS